MKSGAVPGQGWNVVETESKSLDELRKYGEELSRKRVEDEPAYKRWLLAKQTVWLALLAAAFLIFYLIDILQASLALLLDKF